MGSMVRKNDMDRVCGMWVEVEGAPFTSVYKEQTYYFCEQECQEKFNRDPEHYMKGFEGRKP